MALKDPENGRVVGSRDWCKAVNCRGRNGDDCKASIRLRLYFSKKEQERARILAMSEEERMRSICRI